MIDNADLLITLGVGFSKMNRVPEHIRILQIDYDPLRLGKGKDTLPVYGDVGEVILELLSKLPTSSHTHAQEKVSAVKKPWEEVRRKEAEDLSVPIRPPFIMDVLSRVIPPDAIMSIDVGENGWWFGRNFRTRGQKFVMSGYLATMGFGFPGAIAGTIAYP